MIWDKIAAMAESCRRAMTGNPRLTFLVTMVLFVLVSGCGLFGWRYRLDQQETAALRHEGLVAASANRFDEAEQLLGQYIARSSDDAEALWQLARVKSESGLSNAQDVFEVASLLERSLELNPGYSLAQHGLLDMYLALDFWEEAHHIATEIRKQAPRDIHAFRSLVKLYSRRNDGNAIIILADRILNIAVISDELHEAALLAKTTAYERLERSADAQLLAEQSVVTFPESVRTQLEHIRIVNSLDGPAESLVNHTRTALRDHPDLPKFQALHAIANRVAADRARRGGDAAEQSVYADESERLITSAAHAPEMDRQTLALVVRELEIQNKHEAVVELLSREYKRTGDAQIGRNVFTRVLASSDQGLLGKLPKPTTVWKEQPSWLLGFALYAATRRGDDISIVNIVAELQSRKDDPVVTAWLLSASDKATWQSLGDSDQRVAVLRQAIRDEPRNPFFTELLGIELNRRGQRREAMAAWQQTVRLAPRWAVPRVLLSAGLKDDGRFNEAIMFAASAVQLSPRDAAVALNFALVLDNAADHLNSSQMQAALQFIERLSASESLKQIVLPIHVKLLALAERQDQAKTLTAQAINGETKLSQQTLIQLTELSRLFGLQLESRIFEAARQWHGQTLELAYAQAVWALQAGRREDGWRILRSARARLEDEATRLQWQITEARFAELSGDPTALQQWSRIGQAGESNAQVQQLMLTSQLVWRDLELIEATLERLDGLVDAANEQLWLWRARFRLAKASDQADIEQVIADMESFVFQSPTFARVDARLLLAEGYRATNQVEMAMQQLAIAAQLRPESVEISLALIDNLLESGQQETATKVIQRWLEHSERDRVKVAALISQIFVRRGETALGLQVVEMALASAESEDRDRLQVLQAGLYWNDDQHDRAVQSLTGPLNNGEPAALMLASRLYDHLRLQEELTVKQQWFKSLDPILQIVAADPENYKPVMTAACRAKMTVGDYQAVRKLLLPLLGRDRTWRMLFAALASSHMKDQRELGQWLNEALEAVPADALQERIIVADAWRSAWSRFQDPSYLDQAIDVLEEYEHEAPASFAMGVYEEARGAFQPAIRRYRRAIELEPNHAVAMNNLAMVLVKARQSLPEAHRSIERAIALQPDVPAFHDTLAQVLSAMGSTDQAIEQMRQCVRLDPAQLQWRFSLAEMLLHADRTDAAAVAIAEIESEMSRSAEMRERWSEQFKQLKSRVGLSEAPVGSTG